jgi:hypothetical protein
MKGKQRVRAEDTKKVVYPDRVESLMPYPIALSLFLLYRSLYKKMPL